MSYRNGSSYRGPADRSRSPPRYPDRRGSTASIFDSRHSGPPPPRNAADAPRGPRSQFDAPPSRAPPSAGLGPGTTPRTLRDAPPLGSGDRPRPFRERDYPDRRDRSPARGERSPPRNFKEPRDYPPRDIDIRTARRSSRDGGPPSAGSNFSDSAPFASSSYRGGFGRGRGRGDFESGGGFRGGRRALDDRSDLFPRRDRSPPPRFNRDPSRDGREPDRRDERRVDRRDDERRPEWIEKERERDRDRNRRDVPPARLDTRVSTDSVPSANVNFASSAAPPINPERLAIIENSGSDSSSRRPSATPIPPAVQRRDPPPETPASLNGRAETMKNRYGSRGSSPAAQAPPAVPSFGFSIAPSPASGQLPPPAPKTEVKAVPKAESPPSAEERKPPSAEMSAPPINAPSAPKAAPSGPKAHQASPPPTAPRAPRALEADAAMPPSNRLHGVRSLETIPAHGMSSRTEPHPTQPAASVPSSPGTTRSVLPYLAQPMTLNPSQGPRSDLNVPTGPKAVRAPQGIASVSPRPPFTSPRLDMGAFQPPAGPQRGVTPPSAAPLGPRNRSFSASPKVANSIVPTAPKAIRGAPVAPRVGERPPLTQFRAPDRPNAMAPLAPSGPRNSQWNHWRNPRTSLYGDRPAASIPTKRDLNGDEKGTHETSIKAEALESRRPSMQASRRSTEGKHDDRMDVDASPPKRKSAADGHSAAKSFFGGTLERPEDEADSTSEDDELDEEEDATLLEAKHARKERELRAQMLDLSAREYRATSPLESIARLARLSVRDLQRSHEAERQRQEDAQHDEMDVDVPLVEPSRRAVPAATLSSSSEEGQDVSTPLGDDATVVAIREQEDGYGNVRRMLRRSPELISLPYLVRSEAHLELHESQVFQENIQSLKQAEPDMLTALEAEAESDDYDQQDSNAQFAEFVRQWREECEELDRVKEEQEKLERQQSAEPAADLDTPLLPPANPIVEGRSRLHKYSSEYDVEQVLKQSEETARIEQEKLDRETKKNQADMEKEARLPDQAFEKAVSSRMLINENRLRDAERLTLVFSYEPPPDTLTDKEQEIFIAAFKDTPKKWGEIASLLPGRTYRDCIHHYYANKWDGRFRDNRTKKYKGGRRGRGGKATKPSRGSALMADLNRGEDLLQINDTSTGRPKRAAAPTTFGEREVEARSSLGGPSPAKKLVSGAKQDPNGDDKPAKKQRRAPGEGKPGRKGKQQLAALAAAPFMSPNNMPPGPHTKEEMQRAQQQKQFEDASLLANLHGGHPGMMHPEHQHQHQLHQQQQQQHQVMFSQDNMHPGMGDDFDRSRAAPAAPKSAASSYWSVPEQTDFAKYIAHFGTDFAAIAAHMGTKTQTMIKNHYQRQVDGGRSELKAQADAANTRRERGEDIGAPPTPTPIVKRKYDPPANASRTIAPHADPMDADESMQQLQTHAVAHKYSSPQQFQAKPRFTTSAQNTPIPATRAVPSPLAVSTTPAQISQTASRNPAHMQHPLGSRQGFFAETRGEVRPGLESSSMFRLAQEQPPPPTGMSRGGQPPPPAQPTRTHSNPTDPNYLHHLQQEQEKAMRLQSLSGHGHQEPEPRIDQLHPRQSHQMPHSHGSPANQPLPMSLLERKPPFEERRPTPPRPGISPPNMARPTLINPSTSLSGLGASSFAGLPGRSPYASSPPKGERSRPGSVATLGPSHIAGPFAHSMTSAPAPASTPAPSHEPPKKSNLMSILNSDPVESKPAPKRDSLPSASSTRVASPAPPYGGVSTPQPPSNLPTPRREAFGQPSMPGSQYHRSSFGQSGSTPSQTPATLKHEQSGGSTSIVQQQANKQEWQSRMYAPGSQASPASTAPLERDSRPSFGYPAHRGSVFGPSRTNTSTPPHILNHSRNSSLSAQPGQQSRPEPRSILGGPQSNAQIPGQSLNTNPFARQDQGYLSQSQNRAHHSHNTSLGDAPSMLPQRGYPPVSREEQYRREDEARAHHFPGQRIQVPERLEAISAERQATARQNEQASHAHEQYRRQHEHPHQQQQREHHDLERRREPQQSSFSRDGPSPMQQQMQPPYSNPPFAPTQGQGLSSFGGATGPREQSRLDMEAAMRDQQMRQQDSQAQSQQQHSSVMRDRDGYTRRGEEQQQQQSLYRRSTPYGGPQGYPPPSNRR